MSFPAAPVWPGHAGPGEPLGQPGPGGPGWRPTLRRWGALLALAGLVLPGIEAGRAVPRRSDGTVVTGVWAAAKAAALPVTPTILLGEPWEAVVVEPAPPGAPAPWESAVLDPDGTPLPAPAPPAPADPAAPVAGSTVRPAPAPAAPAPKPAASNLVPPHREYLRKILVRYAQENGLPADLVMALAWKESSWRPTVVSSAGAIGVMQLMPATVDFASRRLLGLSYRLNPRDATANIRMATRFLRHLVDQTGGNYRRALIAYNQGITSLKIRGAYGDASAFADEVLALRAHFRQP